jgi:acyl transferase domain-containing protein/acyl carrier protein
MDSGLKLLYKKIKEKTISHEEAAKELQLLASQSSDAAASLYDYNLVPEVYVYDEPYLKDHTVYNEQVLMGVTHGSLAINTFFTIFPDETGVQLKKLNFVEVIEVKPNQQVEVVVEPTPTESEIEFQVLYRYSSSGNWNLTAAGSLQKYYWERRPAVIEELKHSMQEFFDLDLIYIKNPAVRMGDSYKTITKLYIGQDELLARVVLNESSLAENHGYLLHPLIINSVFLPILFLVETKESFLPFGIQDIKFQKISGLEKCWLHIKLEKNSGEMILFNADLINDESQVIAKFTGCSMKRLRSTSQVFKAQLNSYPAKKQLRKQDGFPFDLKIVNTTDLPDKIQKYLIGKLNEILPDGSSPDLEVNLMDLGLQSTQLLTLTNEIEKETKIELNPTLFFEYPNIKDLTEYFFQEHQAIFAQLLGNSTMHFQNSNYIEQVEKDIALKFEQKALKSGDAGAGLPIIANETRDRDDIAIIGMNGQFAEAANLAQFWNNIRDNKDMMKEIPKSHWDYRPWYDETPGVKDKTYCKWGSFINDVDKFDAEFFNISPREANWMDPQLRLLLQSIYATGEDAGYINDLRGTNTGVFVGVCSHDYADLIKEMNFPVDPYMETGNTQTVIANRVSFLFNFTGPSIAIDTACSSSLVALHYACQALRNKECDMAFVGGVNLLLSSYHYRYFSSIGALSRTGRCHTFDESADGYTPGEAIASVLLKSLQQAKRDGDQIYAVIKGSAALHGGYTPSLTAPSVSGEENVILKAWEDARIDPETLSYIEAHGTGTKLGDPIEVNSLKKAFKRFTNKEHFCAIGSVKANMGHAEGAAGLVGVLKVIQQMKHQKIPVIPNIKKINSYIQFDKSPLYINQKIEEWKSPTGMPRRAGVSSFGFAGAYAHIVLEEYLDHNRKVSSLATTNQYPAIIVLSAKNEERLKEQVQGLLSAIKGQQFLDIYLADMAYTLQVGREAMEERLAMVVESIKELKEKLEDFIEGRKNTDDLYWGQVKRNKDIIAMFTADEDLEKIIDVWINKKIYKKLLNLWVKGLYFDWNKLYGDVKPQRISLPTYPFARESYWVPSEIKSISNNAEIHANVFIHPLLHENISDFSEQRFVSKFTGEESFINQRAVQGQRMLPGIAGLEMARMAVVQAMGSLKDEKNGLRLKNVVWGNPIFVGEEGLPIYIGLCPESNGEISYEIYSEAGKPNVEMQIYSQGCAELFPVPEFSILDSKTLQTECSQSNLTSLQIYERLKSAGIFYHPEHVGIEKIYVGNKQVLAKLILPTTGENTQYQFAMHPILLDSILQTAIGLLYEIGNLKEYLPLALQKIEIMDNPASIMWALIRYSDDENVKDKVPNLDIQLFDELGKVCVRMSNMQMQEKTERKLLR